ncbi:MAG: hypothetical protein IT373_10265 [Polyangiaceae bacterium]|nr:hypothetical protein [Polyangiaceae bacterium]
MKPELLIALIAGGSLVVVIVGMLILVARFYRQVNQGQALVINKMKDEPQVTFTGGVVWPIVHRAEVMDISVKTVDIDRRGAEGLICRDNIRADIKVTFFVRVNKTVEDVLKVAQSIGCHRASDKTTLEELFTAKFAEALKSVGKQLDFDQLYTQREKFRDEIIKIIGRDLNGYALEDAAIDYVEQTPLESLDPQNILDADGIRKITDITTKQNIQTNELKQKERMELGKQNLASDEAIFRYEQQRSEAEAKKNKEVSVAQTQQQNEAHRMRIQEELQTKLRQEEALTKAQTAEQNRQRDVMLAEQARLRELAVEQVRVSKAREVEDVGRTRAVQESEIERDAEIQGRKRKIAEIIRERVSVEKGVAEEEEATKDIRAFAGAKRDKETRITGAEAEAQQGLVKEIKQAEAMEEVAKFQARRRLTLADAELEAADRDARAKMRLSEGVQAEHAAPGLAEVRVREGEAQAIEKQGLAKVRVREAELSLLEREGKVIGQNIREKELAEALGIEQKGLAGVKIKDTEAGAIEKVGHAQATAIRERMLAEATGREAEAVAIQKKMLAEATGLAEKANAMKALDGAGREHEEFRLKLDVERQVALETLKTRVEMADKQAEVLAKALGQAHINIVGGDGQFFDRFIRAVSLGQAIDGAVDHSTVLQGALRDLGKGGGLGKEIAGLVSSGGGSEKAQTLASLISRAMGGKDDALKGKLQALLEQAKKLGVGDVPPGGG